MKIVDEQFQKVLYSKNTVFKKKLEAQVAENENLLQRL